MSALLESYVAGSWYAAPDEGTPLADAVTGEEVAASPAPGSTWRRCSTTRGRSAGRRCGS